MYVSPFFFFNDTATTEIYTLSLHDALPIFLVVASREDDDRHGRTPPAKLLQKLEPVPGPQIEVDDRDGRDFFLEEFEGRCRVGRGERLEPCLLDQKGEQVEKVAFVVRKKDRRARAPTVLH